MSTARPTVSQYGRHRAARRLVVGVTVLATVAAMVTGGAAAASAAAPTAAPAAAAPVAALADASQVGLAVVAAHDSLVPDGPQAGDAVSDWSGSGYRWQIQEDNTGIPDPNGADDPRCHPYQVDATGALVRDGNGDPVPTPNFPDDCPWPSIHTMSASPVVSNGDDSQWSTSTPIHGWDGTSGLKPGRYVVSVTANGFQLGGASFTWPIQTEGGAQATVTVAMNPMPIPLGTIQIQVFDDMHSANGQWDQASEASDGVDLSGFRAKLTDYMGDVVVDYYNNPLCATYETDANGNVLLNPDGTPQSIVDVGNGCVSGPDGRIVIPNMAPNRYAASVTPPDSSWIQTTTLEGNRDWDLWLMQNDTGADTEMVVGGEPVPWVTFGYVRDTETHPVTRCDACHGSGEVHGVVANGYAYVASKGGLAGVGEFTGTQGISVGGPIEDAYVAVSDLQDGDQTFAVQHVQPDGTFSVGDLADGDYTVTVWDRALVKILDLFQVTIRNGKQVDLGDLPLFSWFTEVSGFVFSDKNANGRRDPGEEGIPDFALQNLDRTNNLFEQGQNNALTGFDGSYNFETAYPFSAFNVLQAFNPRYKTTGITWWACNDPKKHTILTGAVDVSYLPIISQCGHLDWGVQPYDAGSGENGGIVGSVFYEAERAVYNESQAAPPSYVVGVPNPVTVKLYHPAGKDPNTASGWQENADGSIVVTEPGGTLSATSPETYDTELFHRPKGCVPRNADGTAMVAPVDHNAASLPDQQCIEGPFVGINFGLSEGADGQTVDGNYGLTTPQDEGPGYYVASLDIPTDTVLGDGHPLYQVQTANDSNFAHGEVMLPQPGGSSAADAYAGLSWSELTTPPDLSGQQANVHDAFPNYQVTPGDPGAVAAPEEKCVGQHYTVGPTNGLSYPSFADAGGTTFVGDTRNLCDAKIFYVPAGQSVAPLFHLWTEVPLATKFFGYIVDDVAVSTDKKSITYGEVAGVPNAPVGIYDWTGRLIKTVTSDYNGIWEVLLPSSDIYNCPTPAGICPLVYRFVGNDPGTPSQPNANYNPGYRTISANFQAWPGNFEPADVAPTQSVTALRAPSAEFATVAVCSVKDAPEFFSVNDVVFKTAGPDGNRFEGQNTQSANDDNPNAYLSVLDASHKLVIMGQHFGDTPGQVALVRGDIDNPNATVPLTVNPGDWNDGTISAYRAAAGTSAAGTIPFGQWQLRITDANGAVARNTVTIHVLGRAGTSNNSAQYNPSLVFVGAGADADGNPYNRQPANNVNGHTNFYGTDPAMAPYGDPTQPGNGTPPGNDRAAGLGAIQHAIEVATDLNTSQPTFGGGGGQNRFSSSVLIVVYPSAPGPFNPLGAYYENLLQHTPALIQGVGPGGVRANGTAVQGTVIDGRYYWTATIYQESTADLQNQPEPAGPTAPEPYAAAWLNLADTLQNAGPPDNGGWSGDQTIYEAADIAVYARTSNQTNNPTRDFDSRNGNSANSIPSWRPGVDGMTLQGGDQKDFPGNANALAGRQPVAPEGATAGVTTTQGGALFLNAYADWYRSSNLVVQGNNGAYGSIRVGTPFVDQSADSAVANQTNRGFELAHSRVIANGGTNLAGALGLFDGSDAYRVHHNTFCGNNSTEYGGAISHYGLASNVGGGNNQLSNRIDHNRVLLNTSIDEGGGIMLAGELPPTVPGQSPGLSKGTGPVTVDHNVIATNVSNDDGGGVRLLQVNEFPVTIENNTINDNVSTHEGGGIAIDDALDVRVRFNTIAKNVTTATAVTSDGSPAPAGLAEATVSNELRSARCTGNSQPRGCQGQSSLIEGDLFVDNRAGSWTASGVKGIGLPGDATAINVWDLGGTLHLSAARSLVSSDPASAKFGWNAVNGSQRLAGDPAAVFAAPFDLRVDILPWRAAFRFRPAAIVSVALPPNAIGNYHLLAGSTPIDFSGTAPAGSTWPSTDVDNQTRPYSPVPLIQQYDAGSDEVRP